MFVNCLAALRFAFAALIISAASVGTASAQSSASSDDQWRPAGVVRSTNVQPAATPNVAPANPTYRLPNGQQPSDASQPSDDASNPLRQKEKPKQKATSDPTEPKTFQPPTNAKKLPANQSAATTKTTNAQQPNQQRGQSSAMGKPAPANVSSQVNPAYMQSRQQPTNRMVAPQPPVFQQRPTQTSQMHPNYTAPNGGMWDAMTVAFQGDAAPAKPTTTPSRSTEALPAPGERSVTLPDPVMKHFDGPGAFIGPYQPSGCESGMCCDGSCNGPCMGSCPSGDCCPGPQCGCGCQCGEPSCGEPSCGEPSCACNDDQKDLFSLGPGDNESCHTIRLRWPKWQEVEAFAGVQGFKNPYDRFRDSGNFGFNEGFNIGAKVPYAALGYQFGYRVTEDELSGDANTGDTDSFLQQFATAGLFHRQAEGLNFGAVWDILSDERYTTKHYNQMRSEISIRDGGCHEIGATIIVGLNDHAFNDDGVITSFQASDQYLLFYRFHGCDGGEGRFFAGVNNNSDGLVGADMNIPIGEKFCVQSGFEYLIPKADNGVQGANQEAWNIGLNLVWHWDCQAHKCFENCYRPMFNVADNGTLIVDQQ